MSILATTFYEFDRNIRAVSFTLPTVAFNTTGALFGFNTPQKTGEIIQIDMSLNKGAVISFSIFSKDLQVPGSVYEVAQITDCEQYFHGNMTRFFINQDVPETNTLYIQVISSNRGTGGISTGSMPFLIFIRN